MLEWLKMPEAPVRPACAHLDDVVGVLHCLPRPGAGLAPNRQDACSAYHQVQRVHHQREDDEAARILDARLQASAADVCSLYSHLAHASVHELTRLPNPL